MKKRRILLLSQWFEPEPTFKGLVFARELVSRGYEVEVVTGYPNYPGGKLYPGYRMKWRQKEIIEGVEVTRLPLYPSHDRSAVRRIGNYTSFAAAAAAYCIFQARRADVIYVYQLLTLGVTAALVKRFRGTPVVFDIMDVWPDTLRATGMVGSERTLRAVYRAAQWVYRRVDRIVVLSAGFRKLLIERGVSPEKIHVIYNWCDEESLRRTPDEVAPGLPRADDFRIVFAGNMGAAQALSSVLDAAARLQSGYPHIKFVFLGAGVEVSDLKAQAARQQLNNVIFLPRVSMDEVGAYLNAADAVLVHLKADPLFAITIPGKTQAYMAIGKPILMAAPGEAAALVESAQCGVTARPQDAESIAAAAVKLAALSKTELQQMGRRGRSFYDAKFALAVGVEQFADVFEGAMHNSAYRGTVCPTT